MKKVLIIGNIYFDIPSVLGQYQITQLCFLKQDKNFFFKLIRAFSLRLQLRFERFFFTIDEAINEAKNVDVIILFDGSTNTVLSQYVSAIETSVDLNKTKLYFYFWNTIKTLDGLNLSSNWQVATYDRIDSIHYSYKYVGGFYNFPNPINIKNRQIQSDLFFVGINKGRFKFIRSFERELKKSGLNPNFIYVSPLKSMFNKKYSSPISYHAIIENCINSKSILDITKNNQFGLTLRFYESIFLNKKLITNHQRIIDYDFYNSNNILIIDENTTVEEILHFQNLPYVPYNDNIKMRYSFEMWLMRLTNYTVCFNDTRI